MTGFSAAPPDACEDDPDRRWAGVARVLGPRWSRLPSLTVGLFGVQMLWSVEMSYAPPYLLSLGLSKSRVAIVFLAGPLSGLIVQPMIGILADNSKSRFGRRRPLIIVCAALCALATLLLGFTRPFASMFTAPNSLSNDILTIWLAVFAIYFLDFSINAVQALDRALLVDTIPTAKQPAGNAWAARMLAIGSVAGFFVGNLDLPYLFPFFGTVQLEVLSVFAALLLFVTQAWTCFHVKERILLSSSGASKGLGKELKELWHTLVRLPRIIRQICWIQFFAWLGWFPFLFYSTVYVGDLHKRSLPVPTDADAAMALDVESTRLGTRAMLYSALVSLAANVVMPLVVFSQHPTKSGWFDRVRMHLASVWSLSHLIFAGCMAATFVTSTVRGATLIVAVTGFCWAVTQWAPFALLGEAILSEPVEEEDVGLIRLGDTRTRDVERDGSGGERETLFKTAEDEEDEEDEAMDQDEDEDENGRGEERRNERLHMSNRQGSFSRSSSVDGEDGMGGVGIGRMARARTSRINVNMDGLQDMGVEVISGSESTVALAMSSTLPKRGQGLSAQAGAIIGIHNLFIVIPQFLVTGVSSLIFALIDPAKSAVLHGQPHPDDISAGAEMRRALWRRADEGSTTSPDSVVVVFRLGGIAAAIAFVLSYRLAKELGRR